LIAGLRIYQLEPILLHAF